MNITVVNSFMIFALLSTVFLTALALNIQTVKATAELNILNDTGYLDDFGYYRVLGEVKNVGDQAVEWWDIKASFYNASDNLLCTEVFHTSMVSTGVLDTINPSRKSPFEIVLYNEVLASEVDHYSVTVLSYKVTAIKPIGLKILKNSSYIDEWGDLIINGTIKNIGTLTAESVNVVATYYDAGGNVIAFSYCYTNPSHIEPSLTFPFEIELSSFPYPITNITSYVLTAESNEYAIVPEFPILLILPLFMIATLVVAIAYRRKHTA